MDEINEIPFKVNLIDKTIENSFSMRTDIDWSDILRMADISRSPISILLYSWKLSDSTVTFLAICKIVKWNSAQNRANSRLHTHEDKKINETGFAFSNRSFLGETGNSVFDTTCEKNQPKFAYSCIFTDYTQK